MLVIEPAVPLPRADDPGSDENEPASHALLMPDRSWLKLQDGRHQERPPDADDVPARIAGCV